MLNHSSGSLSETRREYLRKSERDLRKECKKHNLLTDGMKIDLIDRLLEFKYPTYNKRVPIGDYKRTKSKKKKKTKNRHGRSYSIGVTLTSYNKIKKPKTSTSATNIISNTKTKTKSKKSDKKVKPRMNRAQSQISVTENNNLKSKKFDKYTATFPELRMDSLLKLNSIQLNENAETKTEEMVFVEHMSLKEINKLKVNQHIDFRIDNGYVYGAKIKAINKYGKHKKFKIEYKDKNNNQATIYEVNLTTKQMYRFAKYKSLSLRRAHRMNDISIGSSVDINPRYIINEWMVGEVIEFDDNSGQILVEYSRNNALNDCWVHLDNTLEIAPYLSHYEYMKNIVDHYLDYEMKDSTDSEKETTSNGNSNMNNGNIVDDVKIDTWDHDAVCDWFNDTFKKNKLKYDAFLEGIKTFCFYGSDLKQTNELTLRILGVNDENDRKLIMNEINKLCPVRNGVYKNNEIEKQNKQYKSEILQLKAEIVALKSDKKTKTKIKPKSIKKQENKSVNKLKNIKPVKHITSTKKTVKSAKKNENRLMKIKQLMNSNKITKHNNKRSEIEQKMLQVLSKTETPISVVFAGHVDCGKSTLCGRLLYELKAFSTQKLQELKKESEMWGKSSFMYAWYMDNTKDERLRGVTINYKYRSDLFFKTKSYLYQMIDIPGHRDFIKNAIKGISLADVGVIIIPANKGAFEASIYKANFQKGIYEGQTRQHAKLLWSYGIKNIIVCINKMDDKSVNYSQQRFNEIKHETEAILTEIGFDVSIIPFIPISAWKGDNVTKISENEKLMKWYKKHGNNTTLYDAFENVIKSPKRYYNNPLIMPIEQIINYGNNNDNKFICCGKIERGIIDVKKHKKVRFIPSNITGNLHSLETNNKTINFAYCGLTIGCLIDVNGLNTNDKNKMPKKGEIMILDDMNKYKDLPTNVQRFCAEIIVVNHPYRLYPQNVRKKSQTYGYIANVCTKNLCIPAEIVEIKWKIGKRTSNEKQYCPDFIEKGDKSLIVFQPRFKDNTVLMTCNEFKPLSTFVCIDSCYVTMSGTVISVMDDRYYKTLLNGYIRHMYASINILPSDVKHLIIKYFIS